MNNTEQQEGKDQIGVSGVVCGRVWHNSHFSFLCFFAMSGRGLKGMFALLHHNFQQQWLQNIARRRHHLAVTSRGLEESAAG